MCPFVATVYRLCLSRIQSISKSSAFESGGTQSDDFERKFLRPPRGQTFLKQDRKRSESFPVYIKSYTSK